MTEKSGIRIDKFLWAVRIFKTRTIASDECRMGRILIEKMPVKPSRLVNENEILIVRKPPVTHTFKIIKPIENRVSAKLVSTYILDLTPEEEKGKIELTRISPSGFRKKGSGRPTKKERRTIDRWKESKDSVQG